MSHPARRADDHLEAGGSAPGKSSSTAEIEESSEAVFEAVVPLPPTDRREGLVRSGVIVAVAVAVSNLMNVVFQLVTARLLEPAEYSLLVTMLAIILIANVPILALQARVARDVAHAVSAGRIQEAGGIMIESLRPIARWGAVVLIVGAALAVPLAILVRADRELPVLAIAAMVIATLPLPIAWGGLQGSERFALLGASQLVYAVFKLALGIGLAALGFGAAAIVFGLAGATAVTVAISLYAGRALVIAGRHRARRKRRLLDRYTLSTATVLIMIAVLTNLDLIAARAFLDPGAAGHYAAIGVAARGLLLLPIIATTVLFPRVATLRDLAAERSHLLGGLGAVTALGAIPLILFFTIPEELVEVAFGDEYLAGAQWLGPLGAAMLLYALVEVYMFHFLALGRVRYAGVLGCGVALQLALFAVLHSNADQIIAVQGIVAVLLLAASELFDRRDRKLGRSRDVPVTAQGS
jgi:O-antigen/teichoic acid export membrane protein